MNNQKKLGNDIRDLVDQTNKAIDARRRDNILGAIFVSIVVWSIIMVMFVLPAWQHLHN